MLGLELRMTRSLHAEIVADLGRTHEFAHERVGFLFGKYVERGDLQPIVLFTRYEPVADEHYIPSEEFGALIGSDPILNTMQELRNRRGSKECAFHVHMHFHKGQPRLSRADRRGIPPLVPGFQRMSPDGCHGLLILSDDHGLAWGWLPGNSSPLVATSIVVTGAPLSILSQKEPFYV